MKHYKKRLITIFFLSLLLFPTLASSYDFNPFDKSLPEARNLDELFRYPMLAINGLLRGAEEHCNRLPSEKEFEEFILNGEHKSIQCSKIVKAAISLERTGHQIGKNLPHLPES